jgi:hypothetical protein
MKTHAHRSKGCFALAAAIPSISQRDALSLLRKGWLRKQEKVR